MNQCRCSSIMRTWRFVQSTQDVFLWCEMQQMTPLDRTFLLYSEWELKPSGDDNDPWAQRRPSFLESCRRRASETRKTIINSNSFNCLPSFIPEFALAKVNRFPLKIKMGGYYEVRSVKNYIVSISAPDAHWFECSTCMGN